VLLLLLQRQHQYRQLQKVGWGMWLLLIGQQRI
jgi:hypothetical protein